MNKNWILIAVFCIILVIFGMVLMNNLRNMAQSALAPISDSANAMRTQVANVLHPTPTIIPDPVTIINDVRSLARLETIQYSLEKIITADSGQEVLTKLFGDRLLFVAHGVVIAGIDLNQLEVEDLDMRNGVLTVTLPDAEVFIATLDNDKSYVYDRQTGLFTKGEVDLETLARQAAEEEILNAALEDGILEQARLNAEVYLERFLDALGFENVVFE
jgi:hypothetical protein